MKDSKCIIKFSDQELKVFDVEMGFNKRRRGSPILFNIRLEQEDKAALFNTDKRIKFKVKKQTNYLITTKTI